MMEKNHLEIELLSDRSDNQRGSRNTASPQKTMHMPVGKHKTGISSKYKKTSVNEEKEEDFEEENHIAKKKKQKQNKFSWSVWKKMFTYSIKRKYHFLLGLLLNIFFAFFVSLLPLQVGNVLDSITNTTYDETGKNIDSLKNNIYLLGVLTLLIAIVTFARFLTMQFLQEFLSMDMKNDFFKKFIENDLYFFEMYKSGQLVSRLSSDVNQAKSAISNNLTFFIRNIFVSISNIIILFTISFNLTFMIAFIIPVYSFLTFQYSKRSKVLVRQHQDVQAEISAAVTEKFSGIQIVKAYSTQQTETENYSEIITKGYLINRKKIFLTATYHSLSQFLPYLGIMAVLWYGGHMVLLGSTELTTGQLTSFILYCTSLAHAAEAIANSLTNILNGTYAVQKVFEMLQYKPLVDESLGQKLPITGQIEFKNVSFKYPTSTNLALKDLSFRIQPGEYIAFVGESGSGKSTIVKLIEKFYPIQSGNIYFGDHEQSEINAIALRRQIGLVNQDATIFSGTVKENIVYGLEDYSVEDMESAAEKAGCMEFLSDSKRFPKKFDSEIGEKGNNLSGGQKQRISIARALMRKPKIIIFDEATSALDSNSERMVQQSIENLAVNSRVDKPTIIVIAHRLSTVINANRIFVMSNGEIKEFGSHRQLIQLRGYYYQLVEQQLGQNPQLSPQANQKADSPIA